MISQTSPEIGGMGHPIKRKEDLRFIQGKGNYVDDVQLPDMAYGHIVRSPYAHARLKSINIKNGDAASGRSGGDHRRGPGQGESRLDAHSLL